MSEFDMNVSVFEVSDDLRKKKKAHKTGTVCYNCAGVNLMTDHKINPLGYDPVGKLLRRFAIPSIIAMLVGALYNIVDQIFIGNSIGELGNAATNVAFPLTTVCTATALLLGVGSASAFNLSMGRNQKENALYYIGNAASLLFGFGVIVSLITLLFLKPLLVFFGSPADVLPLAHEYVRITAFGFPFLILTSGGSHLIRADGSPSYSMFCSIVGAVINTILDPLLIFVFHMGMSGAAIATVAGQIVSGILVIRYLMSYKAGRLTKNHLLPQWKYFGYAASLGMAQFCNQLAMMTVQIVMNNSLRFYGAQSIYGESIPLACAGIINKVGFIFFSFCIGIAQGMQPIASFNYGAGKYDRVRKVILLSLASGSLICITAFAMFQLFPHTIISLFGSGSPLYFAFAEKYFRIYLFFTFINNIQPTSSTFFSAIGKPKIGTFLALTRQIIFLLPLLVIFPLFMGIDGIMYAGPSADLMAAVISGFFLIRQVKQLNQSVQA